MLARLRGGMLRSLKHTDFRLYFLGQSASMVGRWVQQIGLSWLIFRISGSPMLLGAVFFLTQAPALVLAPLAGAWADRYDRRRIVLIVQALMALQAFLFSALYYLGKIDESYVLLMAVSLGVLNSIDVPARLSMVGQLIPDPADLSNAIALNAFVTNCARFIGPSIGGLLLEFASEGACFLVTGVTFFLAFFAVLFAKTSSRVLRKEEENGGLSEGIRYAAHDIAIRNLVGNVGVTNLMTACYIALMPAFVEDVYASSPRLVGYMLGAAGIGALLGAAVLASRRSTTGMTGMVRAACVVGPIALFAFAWTDVLMMGLFLLSCVGLCVVITNAATNTILQVIAPDRLRGRVLALHVSATQGMAAVGGLSAGALAELLGAASTIAISAAMLLAWGGYAAPALSRLRVHIEMRQEKATLDSKM